jgi:hypothetical protein
MLKILNKQTISTVLLNDLSLSPATIREVVELVWNSDERLEEIQTANQKGEKSCQKICNGQP